MEAGGYFVGPLGHRPTGEATLVQASEMAAESLALGPLADEAQLTGAGMFLLHEFEPRYRLRNSEVVRFDQHESLLPAEYQLTPDARLTALNHAVCIVFKERRYGGSIS